MFSDVPRALVLALALTLLAACGATRAEPASGPSSTGPAQVVEVLDFSAPLVGGGTIDGSSLAGRAVLLWFWAPT